MPPNTTVYSVQCTVYSVQCSVHFSVQYTLYYTINCTKALKLLADLTQSLRNTPSLPPKNYILHYTQHSSKHYIVPCTVYYIVQCNAQCTVDILYTTLFTNTKVAS